jgi:hypothetical protein
MIFKSARLYVPLLPYTTHAAFPPKLMWEEHVTFQLLDSVPKNYCVYYCRQFQTPLIQSFSKLTSSGMGDWRLTSVMGENFRRKVLTGTGFHPDLQPFQRVKSVATWIWQLMFILCRSRYLRPLLLFNMTGTCLELDVKSSGCSENRSMLIRVVFP